MSLITPTAQNDCTRYMKCKHTMYPITTGRDGRVISNQRTQSSAALRTNITRYCAVSTAWNPLNNGFKANQDNS